MILALDQATTTGWAACPDSPNAFTPALVKSGYFRAPKRPLDSERLALIYNGIIELGQRFEPELICIEAPFFPWAGTGGEQAKSEDGEERKSKWRFNLVTVKWLQQVKGVVLAAAGNLSVPFEEYPPQSWRKTFVGFGFAPDGEDDDWMKREVMRKAKALGFEPAISDQADAIGILAHAIKGTPGQKRRQGDLFALTGDL